MFGATPLVRSNPNDKTLSDTSSALKEIADTITKHAPGSSQGMIDGSETIARSIRALALRMEVRRAGMGVLPPLSEMQAGKKTLLVLNKIGGLTSFTTDEISRRQVILREVRKFARQFSCADADYGKNTLDQLEEGLVLLAALQNRESSAINYAIIAEKCKRRGELVLAAILIITKL
jgi:hypothetical protein